METKGRKLRFLQMSVKLETFLISKSKKNGNFEKYQKSLFLPISSKTLNVLQKDFNIERSMSQ